MLQMVKYLPDKCLLRYEYLLLMEEYKARSILNASLGKRKPMDFSKYNKLIPQSVLAKALQFAFFGHTMPITSTGSHLIKPPSPFKQHFTVNELRKGIATAYVVKDEVDSEAILTKEFMMDPDLKVDFMTEEQYSSLFAEE